MLYNTKATSQLIYIQGTFKTKNMIFFNIFQHSNSFPSFPFPCWREKFKNLSFTFTHTHLKHSMHTCWCIKCWLNQRKGIVAWRKGRRSGNKQIFIHMWNARNTFVPVEIKTHNRRLSIRCYCSATGVFRSSCYSPM